MACAGCAFPCRLPFHRPWCEHTFCANQLPDLPIAQQPFTSFHECSLTTRFTSFHECMCTDQAHAVCMCPHKFWRFWSRMTDDRMHTLCSRCCIVRVPCFGTAAVAVSCSLHAVSLPMAPHCLIARIHSLAHQQMGAPPAPDSCPQCVKPAFLLLLTSCTVPSGSRMSLAWVQVHGVLLLPPSSTSLAIGGALLPLLARTKSRPSGTLHLEHCIVVTLCSTLKMWTDTFATANSSSLAQGGDGISASVLYMVRVSGAWVCFLHDAGNTGRVKNPCTPK